MLNSTLNILYLRCLLNNLVKIYSKWLDERIRAQHNDLGWKDRFLISTLLKGASHLTPATVNGQMMRAAWAKKEEVVFQNSFLLHNGPV